MISGNSYGFFIIMTQQINMSTQQMLICRNNQVCLHGIFAYENINVMTLTFIFGHYANKRFVESLAASVGFDGFVIWQCF